MERLLTPFLQMWMFGVVPTCTLSMCIIQSRDGSKLSEMLIAPHGVLAPYLCGLLSASWKHKMCVMFAVQNRLSSSMIVHFLFVAAFCVVYG